MSAPVDRPRPESMFTHSDWPAHVRDGLRHMVATTPVDGQAPIAALDFDETCIRGDISHALLDDLDARRGGGLVSAYQAACRVDRADAYARLVELLIGGQDEPAVRAWTQAVLTQALASGTIALRAPMRELVYWLQRAGWDVWVVTASPQVVVQTVAQAYGVPADRVVGMRTEIGEDGIYKPQLIPPATYRQGKPDALLTRAGRAPTFAAGDSETDTELLLAARYGLIVDRGDQSLRALAAERGYWVVGGW